MKISFKHGILNIQSTSFQLIGSKVWLSVSSPIYLSILHANKSYLFSENNSIEAWDISEYISNTTHPKRIWLYWDYDIKTLTRTFNTTNVSPMVFNGIPNSGIDNYGNQILSEGRNIYDLSSNRMFEFKNGKWTKVIRLFACMIENNEIKGMVSNSFIGSQIGINTPTECDFPVYDYNGHVIRTSDGSFLTRNDNIYFNGSMTNSSRLACDLITIKISQDIDIFDIITGDSIDDTFMKASSSNLKSIIAIYTSSSQDIGECLLQGIITNNEWDFSNHMNERVFCVDGKLKMEHEVSFQPHLSVATILGKSTILFNPSLVQQININDSDIIIPNATNSTPGLVRFVETSDEYIAVSDTDPRLYDARNPLPHEHTANEIIFTPSENLQSDNVQLALEELYTLIANKVSKNGDTITGHLTLSNPPTDPMHAVNKQYVDEFILSGISYQGGTNIQIENGTINVYPQGLGSELDAELWRGQRNLITNAQNGQILVYNGTHWTNSSIVSDINLISLDDLLDVSLTDIQDNQFLSFDQSTNTWINKTVPLNIDKLQDLSDVSITDVTFGDTLVWNGSNWFNIQPIYKLQDLSDVMVSVPYNTGQVLSWDGSVWRNRIPEYNLYVSDINDVNLSNLSNNSILVYDENLDKWIATDILFTEPYLSNLNDVNLSNLQPNDILSFNGTEWINIQPPEPISILSGLSDTDIENPTNGNFLSFSNGKWINSPIIPIGIQDLSDVSISNLQNNHTLIWDGTLSKWKNSSNINVLDSLEDVILTSIQEGQTIIWDGIKWINVNPAFNLAILGDLDDVYLSNPQLGQALIYSTALQKWINGTPYISISQLDDVEISNVQIGQTLLWDGTNWVNSPLIKHISQLDDVEISNVQIGQTLLWDGTNWVNVTPGFNVARLDQLDDVQINSITNGQALVWDQSISKWKPGIPNISLNDLNNVNADTPIHGQTIVFSSSGHWNLQNAIISELQDLSDVSFSSLSNGQVLQYNGTHWVNVTPVSELQDLSDVSFSSLSNGQVLQYNGTHWVNVTPGFSVGLMNDLSDVILSSPSNGQVLQYNGTHWVNTTLVSNLKDLSDVDLPINIPPESPFLTFDGSFWTNAKLKIEYGASFPTEYSHGLLFFKTDVNKLYIRSNLGWVDIGAGHTGEIGITGTIDEIRRPYNVYPSDTQTNVEVISLISSKYYCVYNINMSAYRFQLSSNQSFSNIIYDTNDVVASGPRNISISHVYLDYNTTYYWRVRYKNDENVYSQWSIPTSFTTHPTNIREIKTSWNLKNHNGDYTALLIRGDGNNGDTTTTDLAGHSPVTFNSGTQISNLQSKFGSTSIKFTGNGMTVGSKLDAFGDFYTSPRDNFTIEMWVYPTQLSGEMVLIENFTGGSGPGWTLYTSGASLFLYGSLCTSTISVSNILTTNNWQHIAIVGNGTNVSIYVNGIRGIAGLAGITSYIAQSNVPLWIGRRNNGGAGFVGYMNDIHIQMGVAKYSGLSFSVPTVEVPLPTLFGTPDRIYKSKKTITASTPNFIFALNVEFNKISSHGFCGLGFYNIQTNQIIFTVQFSNTYTKDVFGLSSGTQNSANDATTTGNFTIEFEKINNTLFSRIYNGTHTLVLTDQYTINSSHTLIPFIYYVQYNGISTNTVNNLLNSNVENDTFIFDYTDYPLEP